ncbi:MAG: topoisomerase DNA-binding C4 zinc finger domain-containing protein, partial [Spirochaetes bacterium]|nr:topoisomerase DNA-binding C4 zinc finger domain-containing protein [Spirochaetota bacterium]
CIFKTSKSTLIKAGFNEVLHILKQSERDLTKKLPDLKKQDKIELIEYIKEQHFTQAPPRYTDATIIKFLEENGIGRPSTYAPTITTLISRYYILRKSRQFIPTVLGKLVNKILTEHFPEIVNIDFTAKMEEDLDNIENGKLKGLDLLNNFYNPFKEKIDHVNANLQDHKKIFDEQTGETCEKCGRPMLKKLGRFGFFLACSGFPECRNSKAIPLADCPNPGCNGKIIPKRKSRSSKEFYGCTNFPECNFVTWFKPTEHKCPKCNKFLIEKNDKIHGEYKLCIDPECGYKQLIEN